MEQGRERSWIRCGLVLALVLLCGVLLRGNNLFYADACSNLQLYRSLVEDHDLDLRNQASYCLGSDSWRYAQGAHGQHYSVHEMGWAMLWFPLYLIAGNAGAMISLVVGVTLAAILVARISAGGAPRWAAQTAALAVVATSPVLFAATSFATDWPGAIVLTVALWLLLRERVGSAGLVWGSLLLIRMHAVVSLPAFLLLLCTAHDGTRLAARVMFERVVRVGVAALPMVGLFLFQNYLLFGDPLAVSYARAISFDDRFASPSFECFISLLIDPKHGFILAQPLFAPSWLLGAILMWRDNRRLLIFSLVTLACYGLLYSSYPDLQNPSRYFNILMLLTIVPLAHVIAYAGAKLKR